MNVAKFVREIASLSMPDVFNPYRDTCTRFDQRGAPKLRQRNLQTVLESLVQSGVDTVWMGRDLGYRGGRRTGLALTDEKHLLVVGEVFQGARVVRATFGDVMAERTAAEIWAALRQLKSPPLLWNVFPFHPHEIGAPLTNRKFSRKELVTVEDLNAHLFEELGIRRAISIGQDAAEYAQRFGLTVLSVRHPSYGGTTEFRSGIAALYGLRPWNVGGSAGQAAFF